ncbi:MAG: ribosomal RNA small subunit methyltransferase A, partial [Anaerolineales bacterium]|nr:ribosomal RNA small subunit methyltransferase A [Anaerolineales bacterium]
MDHPLDSERLDIPRLIKEYGLKPDKGLGQNFLIDPHYLSSVADAGEISDQDTVLEIGAGIGNLTRFLVTRAKRVVAVEIDADLIPVLIEVTRKYSNIEIIQGDILGFEIEELIASPTFLVIANIPYYITSKIIRHLMTSKMKPQRVILTIQKEVADRICTPDGKSSLLSLSVRVFGDPSIVTKIPAGAFYPAPKVDSAIVRIDMLSSPMIPARHLETFFYLAKAGFSQKRKNLRNSLSAGIGLDK